MNFPIEQQQQTLWCWAACSSSVEHYIEPATAWTQCRIAAEVLGLNCAACEPDDCNRTASLKPALRAIGRFGGRIAGTVSFERIREEHRLYRPVCVRIKWRRGGAHFVVIPATSFSAGGEPQVHVADPLLLGDIWPYELFKRSYGDAQETGRGGYWTHTYLVEP